jgi:hypothetical protein
MRGVADEDVELPELVDGPLDEVAARLRIGQVAFEDEALPALAFDGRLRFSGVPLFGREGRNRHVSAFARVQDRHGAADAGIAPRDERDLAVKFSRRLVPGRLVLRTRVEVGFESGLGEFLLRERRLRFGFDLRVRHARVVATSEPERPPFGANRGR